MDQQITHIEYFSDITEDPFYFDEHSSQVGFYNANKDTLDDLNEYLRDMYSEGFMRHEGGDMISVSYTTIFNDQHFRGIINDDAQMDLLGQFIALLEGAAENIVNQQGGKKRKRSRKRNKSRKVRRGRKTLKIRKTRKSRKRNKPRKVRRRRKTII